MERRLLPEIHHWTVLQHVAWEGPGLIAVGGKKRGLRFDIRRLDLGAALPPAREVEGLVVLGGPMGVYDSDKYPFLSEERRLLDEILRRERPELGICLGAQLLAHALGARVFPGNAPEIGFGSVGLTEQGKQDPVIGASDSSLPVFHWHGDTFDLPKGATLLASSRAYSHQAFRYRNSAYGLQFHVEPDTRTWSAWRAHLPLGLLEGTEQKRRAIEQVGKNVVGSFFDRVLGTSASGANPQHSLAR